MTKIEEVKRHLVQEKIDGWLLYDFHGNNELARAFLEISPETLTTRRFFYWIPAQGTPIKLVHAIEAGVLDRWPGEKKVFSSWQSLQEGLKNLLQTSQKIAMEYSPGNAVPYIAKVDAGTIDFIRELGITVVSSGSFLPYFTTVFNEAAGQGLIRAGKMVDRIVQDTWDWIASHLREGQKITEYDAQQKILADFAAADLHFGTPPIVAVNEHTADPHYVPQRTGSSLISAGDWILIDLWGKEKHPGSIFADITRVAVASSSPSMKQQELFHVVREAQAAAYDLVVSRFQAHQLLRGWEVDDVARSVITDAGYGEYFIHRTGHSIDTNLHGSGAHMDNLEMHDERFIIPNTAFSIEPGIYLPGEFGIRLEYDLYVHQDGRVEIIGGEQNAIATILE